MTWPPEVVTHGPTGQPWLPEPVAQGGLGVSQVNHSEAFGA
jgi:hypothetical protein